MITAYLFTPSSLQTIRDAAIDLDLSERRVRALCEQGRIPGAFKCGHFWLLPIEPKILPPKPRPAC
jgi:hypothetical protein